MPIIKVLNDDNNLIDLYVHPHAIRGCNWGAYPYCEGSISALKKYRAYAATAIGEMAALQKSMNGDDAKTIKAIRQYFQRQEKASTIVLNYCDAPNGRNDINGWPTELAFDLDLAFHIYEAGRL